MKVHLRKLLKYNHLTNQKYIHYINKEVKLKKCTELMEHILIAQSIWNTRILGMHIEYRPWDKLTIPLFELETENYAKSLTILEKLPLNKMVKYKNSKGIEFNNTIQDVLVHVVNHSTYHKGQIAQKINEEGLVPPISDYIFLDRNKEL